MDEDYNPNTYCEDCQEKFSNSFDYVDHFLDEDEEFDPYLLLENGYKLMLGSLLRHIYFNANKPEEIKTITQSAYVTLYACEQNADIVDKLIENMVVGSEMVDFDKALEEFLEKGLTNGDEDRG